MLFAVFSGIGLLIRGHPTGPPSAQGLMTISPCSAQEGTISRALEPKSFIDKPLESKTQNLVHRSFCGNGYWAFL